ncbi:hypothetical protein FRC00_008270 [Tulasnella sp. 408]|nr:hypothetical protein FRC00_008270 [Tulasnella sp. 408]
MKLSTHYVTSLAFLPSFALAAAIPDGAPHKKDLVKRGGEVNYLANCVNNEVWSHSVYHVSHMVYAETGRKEVSEPVTDTRIHPLKSVNYNLIGDSITWEGKQHDIYFADSGVTVQTHIEADAQSRAFTDWAGWAQRTSDWKYLNCYKDNGRQLFDIRQVTPQGGQNLICKAIYW